MKILYFNQHPLTAEGGGGVTWARGVFPILSARGHEINVVSCRSAAGSADEEDVRKRLGVVSYHEIPSHHYPLSVVEPTRKGLELVKSLLRSSDILYFNNAVFRHAALLGAIKRGLSKPSVAVYHSPLFAKLSNPIQAIYWKTFGRHDTILHDGHQPLNEQDYRILREWKVTMIRKIGAGVDFPFFSENRTPPPPHDRFVVLFCGRLRKDKGFDIFCNAVMKLCSRRESSMMKFLVVGDGPLASQASRLASMCKEVSYLGPVRDRGQLREIYRQSHLVVVPSRIESSSHVLLEAGACGVPSITSDIPPLVELLPPEMKSLITSPLSMHTLADKIFRVVTLWRTDENAYKVAREACQKSCRFSRLACDRRTG